ncbi:hypothetical protein K8R30_01955 [archaeon]|nr:hypothetical protein [archaeon]
MEIAQNHNVHETRDGGYNIRDTNEVLLANASTPGKLGENYVKAIAAGRIEIGNLNFKTFYPGIEDSPFFGRTPAHTNDPKRKEIEKGIKKAGIKKLSEIILEK